MDSRNTRVRGQPVVTVSLTIKKMSVVTSLTQYNIALERKKGFFIITGQFSAEVVQVTVPQRITSRIPEVMNFVIVIHTYCSGFRSYLYSRYLPGYKYAPRHLLAPVPRCIFVICRYLYTDLRPRRNPSVG